MSSATVFLLPVPASPIVYQLSSRVTSLRGTMKNAAFGGAPSPAGGIMPPRNSHCMTSQPLVKAQLPEIR